MHITRTAIQFRANPGRVILRYLSLHGPHRVPHIAKRIDHMSEPEAEALLAQTRSLFADRHRRLDAVFRQHFAESTQRHPAPEHWPDNRRLLLGACMTMEYSTQAAALFNPSMVRHPDQSGLPEGAIRFIMSLRATGESHISSIEFRTGVLTADGAIQLDELTPYATRSAKNWQKTYTKDFVRERLRYFLHTSETILDELPDRFTATEAVQIMTTLPESGRHSRFHESQKALLEILDTNYDLVCEPDVPLTERVIFPNAKGESKGMEDVRFVQFTDEDGTTCYYSTYTAYDGETIKCQLMETTDFVEFRVRTMYGDGIQDKGMALFPEKIDGNYVMLSRQGGEFINIMFSEDLHVWDTWQTLAEPAFGWETVQLGNCGSPIKTEQGWLVLTHGVGPLRRYAIGVMLLDLQDPTRVIGRLAKPIIEPLESEREGYVPNVVYTCGWLRHQDQLIIPYAMSDSACGIITLSFQELLDELQKKNM
ncbi:hypothetical protein BLX24_13725 [Arsenicibacter rosenii]|uniref:Glycosidase n=1 Tax=Arsenicibacter rosenii TaxID=1750698 RepID=A0A1S2VJ20_9BACT|nr:hypothetical protein BLX24_13725 [Arsenicibacter rosenii]